MKRPYPTCVSCGAEVRQPGTRCLQCRDTDREAAIALIPADDLRRILAKSVTGDIDEDILRKVRRELRKKERDDRGP